MRTVYLIGYEREWATHATTNLIHCEWIAWCLGMAELWRLVRHRKTPRRVQVVSRFP